MSLVNCQNCGKEHDNKYCPECGTQAPAVKKCIRCGNEHISKFCPECGYSPQAKNSTEEKRVESETNGADIDKYNSVELYKDSKTMKVMKIVGAAVCAIIAIACFRSAILKPEDNLLIVGIISALATARIIYSIYHPRMSKSQIEDKLDEQDFTISQSLKFRNGKFLVDDPGKKFAISQSGTLKICNYDDMISFELNEDGNSIIKGKRIATVVGGVAFGPFGAMVGAVGKRKQENTCALLVIRIFMNDIKNPQILIPFITAEVKKNSFAYRAHRENAKAFISILTYIENNSSS